MKTLQNRTKIEKSVTSVTDDAWWMKTDWLIFPNSVPSRKRTFWCEHLLATQKIEPWHGLPTTMRQLIIAQFFPFVPAGSLWFYMAQFDSFARSITRVCAHASTVLLLNYRTNQVQLELHSIWTLSPFYFSCIYIYIAILKHHRPNKYIMAKLYLMLLRWIIDMFHKLVSTNLVVPRSLFWVNGSIRTYSSWNM